jgi:hypothetical protein
MPVNIGDCGERGRNRTFNLLIKSQLLCQLSYAPFVNGGCGGGICSRLYCKQFDPPYTRIVATSTVERWPSTTTMPLSVT